MTRLLEINCCTECPHLRTVHTPGSGFALDWICTISKPRPDRPIATYVEWRSEEPTEPPKWCPLPEKP